MPGERTSSTDATFPATFTLFPNGVDAHAGSLIVGTDPDDKFGEKVSAAGDVNGDGIADLIIGAMFADHPDGRIGAGEGYVIFGRPRGFPPAFDTTVLHPESGGDGSRGFVLRGDEGDQVGRSVGGAGDLNDDGFDDVVIGTPVAGAGGVAYVVFGRPTFPAAFDLRMLEPTGGGDGSEGFVLRGADEEAAAHAVASAGDVNADGIDDLLIAANDAGNEGPGSVYVVYGRTTGFPATFRLRTLLASGGGDGSAGFVLHGIDAEDQCGSSVDGAGDINADGIDDIAIGAQGADPAGEAYVVFGRSLPFPAEVSLSDLLPDHGGDGTEGFVMEGITGGLAVSHAGDVNDDAIADLIVGGSLADPGGRPAAGQSYVVYGRATPFPPVLPLSSLLPP